MFRFLHWYLLFLIPIFIYLFLKKRRSKSIGFSSIALLKEAGLKKTIKHKFGRYLILAGVILLVVALARPQSGKELSNIKKEGIDIVVALDVSGSMKSIDFDPNRLSVAKDTISKFVEGREGDRISLVIFSGTAYTKIPLTLDHNILKETLARTSTEDVNRDGTAIGMGISVGINRLKKSNAKSKVIILVTDGENNAGKVNPKTATQLAKDMGIKIYTVGVGSDITKIPVGKDFFGQIRYQTYRGGLDEKLLKQIATDTQGEYFRAKDPNALKEIFDRIDQLEKTKFDVNNYFEYRELAFGFIKWGLLLLLVGVFLEKYLFVKIP
ncbi:Ca-activated chloride channel family protein [Orenia metallireducens]|uniref:Ca-activated chloride channel family protein n=1 Tax=Orenia metallireducens TaxID=1413210 RepID=A0A285GI37_9FIRM|nr:VWA domain-containing protein [Orenia metallireducens]PRX30380.1 Ca-activated chloride channel family protein [Orenia metallireducens]SNY22176.1 Ca-activated chloride channel family protein [Orenia metallireducens]